MATVELIVRESVAQIELSRPEALNAISSELARELIAVTTSVANNAEVHAVVLSAAGDRAFCVGADLKERNAMTDADFRTQRMLFRAAFGGVLNLPQPTVAAVHGFALGGGTELALSCDVVVADETAVMGLPEVTIGLVPGGGGTQLALRRLGPGRAADVVLTGRRIPAEQAHDLGLIDRLVPAGSAKVAATELAAGDRGQLAGGDARGEARPAQRLGAGLRRGHGRRGRGLANGGVLGRPQRGHRGVQRQAQAAMARQLTGLQPADWCRRDRPRHPWVGYAACQPG